MTAREIQRRLIYDLFRRNFVVPNFTPSGWFECDVFEITQAGFFREYEIKLSRSDFFADADKFKNRWPENWWQNKLPAKVERKHESLSNGRLHGPCRFYFVTPNGLVRPEEIPHWAGLIVCGERAGYEKYGPLARLSIHTLKQAPVLHRCKIDPAVRQQALETLYWRFHNLLR